jgi:hypothetical protein
MWKSGRHPLRFAIAAVVLVPTVVRGFLPDQEGHLGITSEALQAESRTVNGRELRFTARAVEQIVKANKKTDDRIAWHVATVVPTTGAGAGQGEQLADLAIA